RPVLEQSWQIDTPHSPIFSRPPIFRSTEILLVCRASNSFLNSPVCRHHRHFMPECSQSARQRLHLRRRSTKLVERSIRLRHIQDSHTSRRIFFSDFAKTLNRNSFSTRSFPRRPISRASSGFASNVSIDVASCTASPCCTKYPVTPS